RAGLSTTLLERRASLQGPLHLVAEATSARTELRLNTTVWGIWGHELALWSPDSGCSVLGAHQVILATGAFERPVAFPGWTLPGVITAGGARRLLEQGVAPGERVCVAGYGPWLASIAADLRAAGVHLVGVVDASARPGRVVVRAEGTDRVERVVVAGTAADWSASNAERSEMGVDALVLACGLLPENQLARLAGCSQLASAHVDPAIERDPWMRTSAPGILVAGDAGAVRGPDAALDQGRLAGLAAAVDAGGLDQITAASRARTAQDRLSVADAAKDYSPPRPGLLTLPDPDTVICRCEDVTMREIQERLFEGTVEPGPVIAETRAAMGACQGRHCASLVAAVISRQTGSALERIPPVTPRPPVLPVPLGALAERPPEFETDPRSTST
ncbi:MAG: FAD-dependent oxidoreductase, partial [Chloroflexi bacterium]|nr:FAD-dependent oxidoreductase [Chloroflexota bacterium]